MKIIYEDKQLLVVEKAAGEAVQSANIRTKDLESQLKMHLMQQGGDAYLGIIHRLDQPVQGLVVFAKTRKAAGDLSRQLQDGRMRKWYTAKVRKTADAKALPPEGMLINRMEQDKKTRTAKILADGAAGGKEARLSYRFLSDDEVEILLDTGRFHQIRAQFARAGYPLCGDHKYGIPDDYKFPCLCASRLTFEDPGNHKTLEFTVDPSDIPFLHP